MEINVSSVIIMSSRHSHGSETSREPSKNQLASTPEPKENLQETETEETVTEQKEQDVESEKQSINSEPDEILNGEEPQEEKECGEQKESQGETEGENEVQEEGYEAEAEGEDQHEVSISPPPEVEEQSPEDFESKVFLENLSELVGKLQSETYQSLNEDYPVDELKNMVTAVVRTMNNFRDYSKHCQQQMEDIRENMKSMRERIHKKIASRPYDPNTSK